MDDTRLFAFLQQQAPAVLIEVLQNAYRAMTTKQRQAVFAAVVQQIPPAPVDGAQLQSEIHAFYHASVAGAYYAPFAINFPSHTPLSCIILRASILWPLS